MNDINDLLKKHEKLISDLLQAKIVGNISLRNSIQTQLEQVDDEIWKLKINKFPELIEFQSLFDALKQTANKLGVSFPDIKYSKRHKFTLILSDDSRSILIMLRESNSSFVVEIKDDANHGVICGGNTTSLSDVVILLSEWFTDRLPLREVVSEFSWLSCE